MKKASWTQKTHLFKADEYICSACGASSRNAFICHRQRHCAIPRCGAKMKNGRYEASWVDEAEALSAILDDDW